MGKKKGAARRKRLAKARISQVDGDANGKLPAAAKEALNPFAQHRNARPKHEVVGRRVRGGERNMVVARAKVLDCWLCTACWPALIGGVAARGCPVIFRRTCRPTSAAKALCWRSTNSQARPTCSRTGTVGRAPT